MSDDLVSVDEFLSKRKDFVKSGDILLKANRAPSTWNQERRSAQFVVSAEVEDRDRDVVWQDGLDTTQFSLNPVAFFNHASFNFPVGTWSDLNKVAGRPKRTEGTLTLVKEGVEETADKLALHLAGGSIRACSIGFIPKSVRKRAVPDDKKDAEYYWPGFDILSADLCEISPCTVPSNPAALAKMAADGDVTARDIIEDILDNWARSPAGILMPREEFERAQKTATNNRTVVVVMGAGQVEREEVEKAVSAALAKEAAAEPKPEPKPAPVQPQPGEPELSKTHKGIIRRAIELFVGSTESEEELAERVRREEERRAAEASALEEKRAALAIRLAAIDEREGAQKVAA